MKQFVGALVVFLCIAMSSQPSYPETVTHDHIGEGWCQQPITRNTFCPNAPVAGSNFCSEHQRPPAETRKGDDQEVAVNYCIYPPWCGNVALTGGSYCWQHLPPPPGCKCGYTLSTGQLCNMPCVFWSNPNFPLPRCAAHQPIPPLQEESEHDHQ